MIILITIAIITITIINITLFSQISGLTSYKIFQLRERKREKTTTKRPKDVSKATKELHDFSE